jgi:hypothetical protein
MAANLVSSVMQFLTPETIGRIASILGIDSSKTQSAIGAAVPGMLAGLSNVAAQPGGAQRLADAANREGGMLSSFSSMLSSGSQGSIAGKGKQMLASLIGTRDETTLAGAVGTYAGMSRGSSDSLLGMLTPVVMGTIAQEQGTRDPDGRGIAGFLASQRDSILAAMPSGFRDLLSGTGLLDTVRGTERVIPAPRAHDARAGKEVRPTSNWLYWVIGAIALAAVLSYLLGQRPERVTPPAIGTAQNLTIDGFDIRNQINESMAGLRTTLAGITDTTSAQNALPRLGEISGQIDRMSALKGRLSAEQQAALTGLINQGRPALDDLVNRAVTIPGVAGILRPTLDPVMSKLYALAS